MSNEEQARVRIEPAIAGIDGAAWDACANPVGAPFNPFLSHAFLAALEESGCVGGRTGWSARHLVLEDAEGAIAGVAPAYLKAHSQGEYVFDQGWAEAYMRAGGRYYPKLVVAVPFTPVPGRRLLVPPGPDEVARERLLAAAVVEVARQGELSSVHVNFLQEDAARRLGNLGFLLRNDQQFHWSNAGYCTFDDFLATLSSRHRKAVRKERATAVSGGLQIVHKRGADITQADWDAFFDFYMDTGNRKWGRPYLNRRFFSLLGTRLADHCLLILALRDGRPVAGALNLIGGDCLYGRYWGAIEHHSCLHFELCYHQAIEFAIAHGLARVEAGAQGDHKLARGYLPVTTWSAHWIADPGLRRAVARFLDEERRVVAETGAALTALGPYRKDAG